jgi:hypothetical protein
MKSDPTCKSLYKKSLSISERKSMEDYYVYIAYASVEEMESDRFTRGTDRAPKGAKYIPRHRYVV